MAVPTVLTPGTAASGTAGVSPGLPSGIQANDILILVIEGEGEDASADAAPTGGDWTAIDGGTGSVASAEDGAVDRTRVSAYWHRYDGSNNPSTSVPDAGDHTHARIFAFRGCRTTGSPFDVVVSGTDAVNRTAHRAFADGVTTIDDCLVVLLHGHGDDVTCTSYANAYLSSVAEIDAEVTSTSGSDSTIGAASGSKATPGTLGIWTWTTSAIEEKAWWCVALAPSSTASATDTVSLDSGSNSGSLWSSSTVYDTARSGGSISSLGQSDSRIGQTFVSPNYRVGACYLEFDLSALPASINVSEVLLALKAPNYADGPAGTANLYAHDFGTFDTADWIDHTTWSGTLLASIDFSTWVHSEWWDFTESGTGLKDAIEAAAGGTLRLVVLASRPLAGTAPSAAEYATVYTYDATGLGPSLHISYTEAGLSISAPAKLGTATTNTAPSSFKRTVSAPALLGSATAATAPSAVKQSIAAPALLGTATSVVAPSSVKQAAAPALLGTATSAIAPSSVKKDQLLSAPALLGQATSAVAPTFEWRVTDPALVGQATTATAPSSVKQSAAPALLGTATTGAAPVAKQSLAAPAKVGSATTLVAPAFKQTVSAPAKVGFVTLILGGLNGEGLHVNWERTVVDDPCGTATVTVAPSISNTGLSMPLLGQAAAVTAPTSVQQRVVPAKLGTATTLAAPSLRHSVAAPAKLGTATTLTGPVVTQRISAPAKLGLETSATAPAVSLGGGLPAMFQRPRVALQAVARAAGW